MVRSPTSALPTSMHLEHLELTQGIAGIEHAATDHATTWVLTLHGRPVGRMETRTGASHSEVAADVRAWLEHGSASSVLDLLATWATAPGSPGGVELLWHEAPDLPAAPLASLTIAVCTRDRPDSLRATLDRLQDIVCPGVDVIVVDNAPSTEATRSVMARRFSSLRYVRENAAGLDRARNRAIEESTADVIAFCDDDALAAPGWATALRSLFGRNPDVSLATGLVLPASLASEPACLFERYGGFGRGYDARWLHAPGAPDASIAFRFANTGAWGTGTNMALRRRIVRQVGGFDPALDVGTPTNGGGDLEMMFRVLKAGGLMAYTPHAVVYHHHRETWKELVRQVEGWGTGMSAHLARVRNACPDETGGVLALRAWLSLAWFARRYASSWVRPTFPRELILTEWRASFRGASLYRKASRHLPPPDAVPALHPPVRAQSAARTISLDDANGALRVADAARVRLTVTRSRRVLGTVDVSVIDGHVGEDRWRHAVAGAMRHELLGADDASTRRTLGRLFGGARP